MTLVGEEALAADKGFSTSAEGGGWSLLTIVAVDDATPDKDKGFSTSFEGEEWP